MKKSSALYFIFMSFIIGALIASFAVYFFVHINMIEKIENKNKSIIESLNKKIEDLKNLNQKLEILQLEKKKSFRNLINELKKKDYSILTKDILLSKDIDNNADYNKLLLKSGDFQKNSEITEDAPYIKELKKELDFKTKEILRSASYILKGKINKLNLQIMDKNKILSDINLKLDNTNSILDNRNLELNDKIKSINIFKDKLQIQNKKLVNNLEEINKYKNKLELHKKQIDSLQKVEAELNKTMSALETKVENGKLKVSFKGDILFSSGSHNLKKEGKTLINSVFPILKNNIVHNNIFIAGHTDNEKIKESTKTKYESNWDLSTYRAIEVVKYLTSKGISPDNITAAGFGKFRPIADNSTKLGRQKNRRVELFIIPKIIKRNNVIKK